jgi:LDH2 family malate/lactate/ureidoglycolate dehydrogenase
VVWAERRGLVALGVRRIPQFVARMRAGGTKPSGEPVVETHGAFHVVDADDMWGHVVGARTMQRVIETARQSGISVATVRNTTTPGALGYYARLAVDAGMIGIAMANTPPLMAAWGGTSKVLGNQPFAIGAPAGRHPALLLDMASSGISTARIKEYESRGEPLPPGVAADTSGLPTTDPAAAMEARLLLPMGRHRGYALAVMWEVLTGVLAGGARPPDGVTGPDDHARPSGVSMFLMAIDVTASMPDDTFRGRVDALVDHLQASPTVPGVDQVRVPGQPEHTLALERRRGGIPLPPDTVDALRALGEELGVPWPAPDADRRPDPATGATR